MAVTVHNYEMQGGFPDDPIQAEYMPITDSFSITSKEPLVIKRGWKDRGVVPEIGSNNMPNKRAGWYRYRLTEKAYETFIKNNDVTIITQLD